MVQLIDTKTEYYVPKFNEMRSQSKSTSWNWPAFLITPYWMLYRKMYGIGAAILAVDLVVSFAGSGLLSLLALIGYICCGIFGNSIYMKHLEKKADEARCMDDFSKYQFISANKGVSLAAALITAVVRMIVVSALLG